MHYVRSFLSAFTGATAMSYYHKSKVVPVETKKINDLSEGLQQRNIETKKFSGQLKQVMNNKYEKPGEVWKNRHQ